MKNSIAKEKQKIRRTSNMATLQIEFKNRKFVSHNGVDVKSMTDTHLEGNGWYGYVDEKGNITFIANHYYKGERHQLKFEVENGYLKKTLKIGNHMPKVLKTLRIAGWPLDGVIGLSAGFIDKRTCYFRTAEFQQFLDDNGLTAVRYEPVNGIYTVVRKCNEESTFWTEEIETDGKVTELGTNYMRNGRYDNNNKLLHDIEQVLEVTGATWTIKTAWKRGVLNNRILYTLDNPREIKGLPKKFKFE